MVCLTKLETFQQNFTKEVGYYFLLIFSYQQISKITLTDLKKLFKVSYEFTTKRFRMIITRLPVSTLFKKIEQL